MLDVACNHKFASVQIFLSSFWAFATAFAKVKKLKTHLTLLK